MSGDPFPKSAQLARGERRYRRKVASPKQWQSIIAAKGDACRVCAGFNAFRGTPIQYHHIVSREDGGDDKADNIVPLCAVHHMQITQRKIGKVLMAGLSDAEYAYMIERGGEDYPERAYGVRYER